ncbi:MAG: hypothetical protein M3Y04_10685 [Actinomycetota bacterium]|nr:hypothetical protein [Actinomycetota bacterium]
MRRFPFVPSAVLALTLATACSLTDAPATNVQPPRPGVPASGDQVTGIYRSIHQGVLQLRSGGDFVLIVPEGPGPTSGTFTLSNGHMEVRSKPCGVDPGTYDVTITGEQQAGKAVLNLAAVQDTCEARRHYLTADPWVYANS